jgi:hypothetical protein
VINTQGERVYTNHLKKISDKVETLYLIGNKDHKSFMKQVFQNCMDEIGYNLLSDELYSATIKDKEGEDKKVDNYMMTLRSNKIKVYHKK